MQNWILPFHLVSSNLKRKQMKNKLCCYIEKWLYIFLCFLKVYFWRLVAMTTLHIYNDDALYRSLNCMLNVSLFTVLIYMVPINRNEYTSEGCELNIRRRHFRFIQNTVTSYSFFLSLFKRVVVVVYMWGLEF